MLNDHIIVRPEAPSDISAIRSVTDSAFDRPDESAIVDALRVSDSWLDLSYVAVDESRSSAVIAHAMLTRCRVGDAAGVCLAPCSVLPSHQRSGVGGAVIEALLAEAARRDEDFAVVLGHPVYYPRFGFLPASTFGISLHVDVPDEALMAMPLAGEVPAGALRFAPEFGV